MKWNAIGSNVIGTSHLKLGSECEDSYIYKEIVNGDSSILICVLSDGAGSAKYAKLASQITCDVFVTEISSQILSGIELNSTHIYKVCEQLYDTLKELAKEKEVSINEFSCTLVGTIVFEHRYYFFQIGDGAIIYKSENDFYVLFRWPDNGEFLNTTNFLIQDPNLGSLQILESYNSVDEFAIFSDGLQNLALVNQDRSVYQPFFLRLFPKLRLARNEEQLLSINRALENYLSSDLINERTDDDKTLILATRRPHDL